MKKIFLLSLISILFTGFSYSQNKPDTVNRNDAQGMKTGYWEEQQMGILSKGRYDKNLKTGTWVSIQQNNMLLMRVEDYSNGKKNGVSLTFDGRNRLTAYEYFKNDVLDGISIHYSAFNEWPMSEITYSGGKRNGSSKIFYDNGKLQEYANFKEDRKDGIVTWYNKNGKMMAQNNYKNGQLDGVQKTFYENDTLESITSYLDNKMAGDYKEFYRTGKIKIAGKYVDDVKEGTWTEYDETGKAVRTEKFKKGVKTN